MAHPQQMPKQKIAVEGREIMALIDTGCTTTIVHTTLVGRWKGKGEVVAFDGSRVKCRGRKTVTIDIAERRMRVHAIVTDRLVPGVQAIIGMDVICRLGGVTITCNNVRFGLAECAVTGQAPRGINKTREERKLSIKDQDFRAEFDGERWTVEWAWKHQAPLLTNRVACYRNSLRGGARKAFEQEVDRWIEEGILMPWTDDVESGILPLMAVLQTTKGKV